MKMHPCQALMLLLYAKVITVLGVPIANIDCGDVCSATPGSSYTLSCTWSGRLTTGITWRRDGSGVMVCNTGGVCLPSPAGYASGSYPNSTTATLTITSYSASTDAGNWECQDGSDPSKSCTLPSVASGSLEGKCTSTGSDYNISCYGITNHGSPSATIDLKEGSTILASTTSGGSVSSLQTDAAGKTYSCSVTGAAAVCLTPKNVHVTCPDCVCDAGNIIFIVLLLICLVSKFGSDIYFLIHSYFPKKKYRNPSDHKVGVALETTIKWTEEHSPQHSAYKENKMKIENEIKRLCGNRITIQNLSFENINKHLQISFHFMEEDVIFSTFSQRFTNERILGKEIKKVTEQNYHIYAGSFEGVHLFKNGDILVNRSESTACKVSLEYNCFLFPVITLKSLTDEGMEIKRPVKKSHPVCLMGLLTILNIVVVVAALILFLVCSLQELETCHLGIGVIVVDGMAFIWLIVNIIVLFVCRDWIWISDVKSNSQPRSALRPLPPHPRVQPDSEVRTAPLNLPRLRSTPRVQTDVETETRRSQSNNQY